MNDRDAFRAALGAEIRRLREKKQLSRSELARAVGCSWQQLNDYENGFTEPTAYRLEQLAASLGVKHIKAR